MLKKKRDSDRLTFTERMMLANETCRPVTSLAEGEEGIIHDIAGGHALISRLAGMGIVLNTRIRFLQASGGLVIVQVADTRVALGAGEAAKILVDCLPPRGKRRIRGPERSSSPWPASPTRGNRRCSTS